MLDILSKVDVAMALEFLSVAEKFPDTFDSLLPQWHQVVLRNLDEVPN